MAQNHSELIFLVPWFVLMGIAISMVVQGWMVVNGFRGYSKDPLTKHPEMNEVTKGEPLLVIRFTNEDLEKLQQRVTEQKMMELFEEPSSYEDENDDDD